MINVNSGQAQAIVGMSFHIYSDLTKAILCHDVKVQMFIQGRISKQAYIVYNSLVYLLYNLIDPVNHTLIVNDEMELTGVPGIVDEPPDDFGESQGQNNKVDYNFLRSLISSDKKANWYGAFLQTNIFSNKIFICPCKYFIS